MFCLSTRGLVSVLPLTSVTGDRIAALVWWTRPCTIQRSDTVAAISQDVKPVKVLIPLDGETPAFL